MNNSEKKVYTSTLAERMAEESKGAVMYDIFTPEERLQFIRLRSEGKYEEAEELVEMAEKRNILY